jgi:hypothetical protein
MTNLPPVPPDYPVQPFTGDTSLDAIATCGSCGRSWDDSVVTSMTPAPSARCPFEPFHAEPATYYAVGNNVAGYMPEADVEVFEDFDRAKRYLIDEMLRAADYAETETIAEELTNSAEDVNLWNGPDCVYVEMIDSLHCIPTAWWITETDEAPESED